MSQAVQQSFVPGSLRSSRAVIQLAALAVFASFGVTTHGDCPADLDGSGGVGGSDIGLLLAQWGKGNGSADLNGDGKVDGKDFGILMANWGGC